MDYEAKLAKMAAELRRHNPPGRQITHFQGCECIQAQVEAFSMLLLAVEEYTAASNAGVSCDRERKRRLGRLVSSLRELFPDTGKG